MKPSLPTRLLHVTYVLESWADFKGRIIKANCRLKSNSSEIFQLILSLSMILLQLKLTNSN